MMLVFVVVWVIGVALATYLFNFNAVTRFWALGLVMTPPLLGVTLAKLVGPSGSASADAMHVQWWVYIAATMVGLSLTLSVWEILRYRALEAQAQETAHP
jgi:hypothetical protein